MKTVALAGASVIALASLLSCSSVDLRRTAPLNFDTLFVGKVEARRAVTLQPNESMAGRVLVGLVSAGPIGAIGTANTERDFSTPRAYEYALSFNSSEKRTVMSRSIVETESCVEVVSSDESDFKLLIVVAADRCDAAATTD